MNQILNPSTSKSFGDTLRYKMSLGDYFKRRALSSFASYYVFARNSNLLQFYHLSSSTGAWQIALVDAGYVQGKWRLWLCKEASISNGEASM